MLKQRLLKRMWKVMMLNSGQNFGCIIRFLWNLWLFLKLGQIVKNYFVQPGLVCSPCCDTTSLPQTSILLRLQKKKKALLTLCLYLIISSQNPRQTARRQSLVWFAWIRRCNLAGSVPVFAIWTGSASDKTAYFQLHCVTEGLLGGSGSTKTQ